MYKFIHASELLLALSIMNKWIAFDFMHIPLRFYMSRSIFIKKKCENSHQWINLHILYFNTFRFHRYNAWSWKIHAMSFMKLKNFSFCNSTSCKNHAISHTSSHSTCYWELFKASMISCRQLEYQREKSQQHSWWTIYILVRMQYRRDSSYLYTKTMSEHRWEMMVCPRSEHFNLFHPLLYSKHSHGF